MRALTAAEVLTVWDHAQGESTTTSALLALAAALDRPWDDLVNLPLGSRDALLLQLRRATLGPRLDLRIDCPSCGEALEFTLTTEQLLPPSSAQHSTADGESQDGTFERGDLSVRLRPLTSADLLAVEPTSRGAADRLDVRAGDGQAVQRQLIERALVSAHRPQTSEPASLHLDEDEQSWVEGCLQELDPGAETLLTMRCPACDDTWSAPFDIATFLHIELGVAAERLLDEIHLLARVYGWREADILAMSARRRRAYLDRALP